MNRLVLAAEIWEINVVGYNTIIRAKRLSAGLSMKNKTSEGAYRRIWNRRI